MVTTVMTMDTGRPAAERDLRSGFSVETFADLPAAEAVWRAMERDAVASPYQRYDWVAAYAATAASSERIRVALVRDQDGRPVLLAPLSLSRRAGLTVASGVGGKHANFHMPLMAPAGAPAEDEIADVLRRIGRGFGIDLFAFANVPSEWGGRVVPLARDGRPSPSNAYATPLASDPESTFLRAVSADSRKRMRQKERNLAKLGTVGLLTPETGEQADRVLDAFFRQKEERFRSLGIADPFLEPGVRDFLRRAARPAAGAPPAVRLYALTIGDDIVSAFGGAADERRISGMFLSFDAGHEASRFSPGDVLVARVIADSCRRGLEVFDLGVGEARYKTTFCDATERLADVVAPVTVAGALYADGLRLGLGLKRRIKQNPRAMRLVSLVRRARARLAG